MKSTSQSRSKSSVSTQKHQRSRTHTASENYGVLPSRDFSFKRIFSQNAESLISLIEAITSMPKGTIRSLKYVNKELEKDHDAAKTCIMDLVVELLTGQIISIEIQLRPLDSHLKRARYYAAALLRDSLKSGEGYDRIPPIISIHLLDYNLYPDLTENIHEYEFLSRSLVLASYLENEPQRKQALESASALVGEIIYIVELRKKTGDNNSKDFIDWMHFMTEPYVYQDELCHDLAFKKAYQELKRINADPRLRALYDAEEKQLRDQISAIDYATSQGTAKGRAAGLSEGKAEGQAIEKQKIALNLLKAGMSIEFIAQTVGCDMEWVRNIKNAAL